jgi:hypothetical protein
MCLQNNQGMVQVAECLAGKYKAPTSNSTTSKNPNDAKMNTSVYHYPDEDTNITSISEVPLLVPFQFLLPSPPHVLVCSPFYLCFVKHVFEGFLHVANICTSFVSLLLDSIALHECM